MSRRVSVERGGAQRSMDGEGTGLAAATGPTSRTSAGLVDVTVVTPAGPESLQTPRRWSSPVFAPSAAAVQSVQPQAAGHLLTLPPVRPHSMMYCPPESALASSASASDRDTSEHAIRRVSVCDPALDDDHEQHRRYVQRQQKRRRPYYPTDLPSSIDLITSTETGSTLWNESSTSVFDSSPSLTSPFLRHHHHQQRYRSYRPLSFPYPTGATSAAASSLLLPQWSADLLPVRRAVGPASGAVRPPTYACPMQRVDTQLSPRPVDVFQALQVERGQQHQPRRLSMPEADKLWSFGAVTHQSTARQTSARHRSSSSCCGGGDYQLSEGNSSLTQKLQCYSG